MTQIEKNKLPEGWVELIAEDYCLKVADGTHDSPKKMKEGKLLITSKNIKNSKLDISSAYKISIQDFDDVNKRSKVDKWDILLGMIGTVGEVCLIDHKPDFAIKNVGLFKCGIEFKAKWLYYYLKSSVGKEYILSRLNGTTQKYITLGDLRKIPVKFPENPKVQKSIAKILSSFDDKIELLREQNETLENIGQEIFKEWFGKYKVGDELPEGWRVGKIKDLGKIICGKTPSKSDNNNFGGNVPFIKIPDMHGNMFILNSIDTLSEKGANSQINKILPKNSISISCIATVGLVSIITKNSQTNQQINSIIPNDNYALEYGYYLFKNMYKYLNDIGSGGTATLNVNTGSFSNIEIIIPNKEILERFNEIIQPLFKKIKNNSEEIQELEKSRDLILPRLMKGDILV